MLGGRPALKGGVSARVCSCSAGSRTSTASPPVALTHLAWLLTLINWTTMGSHHLLPTTQKHATYHLQEEDDELDLLAELDAVENRLVPDWSKIFSWRFWLRVKLIRESPAFPLCFLACRAGTESLRASQIRRMERGRGEGEWGREGWAGKRGWADRRAELRPSPSDAPSAAPRATQVLLSVSSVR